MGSGAPQQTNMRTTEDGIVLGAQLDDEVHCDIEVDICLGGHSNNLTLEGILIAVQPLGSSNECVGFLQSLEESVGNALFADSHDVASLDQIAGDVDAVAIDSEVAMVHQLASLTTGVSEAQTINNVIQAPT